MSISKTLWAAVAATVVAGILIGCTQQSDVPPSAAPPLKPGVQPMSDSPSTNVLPATSGVTAIEGEEHGHKPGAHGGIMVSLGRDSYHVEAVFEKGGHLRLHTLGKDETRVIDVETQALRGFAKVVGETESESFVLQAEPQEGDKPGRTSQFSGKLPTPVLGKDVEVTIPNIVIDGERFRLGFQSTPEQVHSEEMPAKVADEEEQALYLTPGGKYTEEDIVANGRIVASAKFKGLVASHDLKPKAGDRICPITLTKANPKFTWIIGGKPYEFCCPPCVDEFVKLAKEKPDEIKEPNEYVQK